ncbi:rifin PIR protein, putative [Plasmodium reichenowi]|uniref:Rifin PIR protein, putative n=1 Tax=Plasmodium reichenowi TaxID=5854 RepID=A0A2P9D4S2_PLARE|nr:rifin PIR protein, putative [Plasmodium reichenowi]
MKVHYINILLFALPLNILEHNHRNHKSPTHYTPKVPITRSLCECELYMPNYDNDPKMKDVMENYNRYTSERFKEYDERMKTTRQKYKEQCDKEIEKIILKDKLEKELMDKFATLDTYIQSDALPTCICEKSLADKTEKFCLNCSKNMGAIAPWWGLVCGVGYAGWLNSATAAAMEYATKKGIQVGVKAVIEKIIGNGNIYGMLTNVQWTHFITGSNYNSIPDIMNAVTKAIDSCEKSGKSSSGTIEWARRALSNGETKFGQYVTAGKEAAAAKTTSVQTAKLGEVATTSYNIYSAIGYSVIAIVVIILIMVIIYLVLRYRRRKKMKKKFQYIKLLNQ